MTGRIHSPFGLSSLCDVCGPGCCFRGVPTVLLVVVVQQLGPFLLLFLERPQNQ